MRIPRYLKPSQYTGNEASAIAVRSATVGGVIAQVKAVGIAAASAASASLRTHLQWATGPGGLVYR